MNAQECLEFAELLPEAMFVLEDQGRILACNPAAERLLGRPRRDVLDLGLQALLDESPEKVSARLLAWARCKALVPGRLRWLAGDGGVIDCHCSGGLLKAGSNREPARILLRCQPRQVVVSAFDRVNSEVLASRRLMAFRRQAQSQNAYLSAIVESSVDAIIGKDLNGIVKSWNPGAERILGYTRDEMLGVSITRLIPSDRLDEETRILSLIGRGGRVENLETLRLTKDGRLIEVSVSASPIHDQAGRIIGVSLIARDITAIKAHEREIDRLSRLYAALSQVNQAIVWTNRREELLPKVCRVLVEQGGFRMAWIGWHEPGESSIEPVAAFGDVDGYLETIRVFVDERPEGLGPGGTAFRTGRTYVCNDSFADPTTLPWRAALKRHGFRASAVFPIRMNAEVRGTLSVYADHPGFFQDREIALLAEAALDVSFALDNFARERKRRESEHRYRALFDYAPMGILLADPAGTVIEANAEIRRMIGGDRVELNGRNLHEILSDSVERGAWHAEGESGGNERLIRRDDGSVFTAELIQKSLPDGALLVMIRDVSERLRAESERVRRRQAEAADRVKSAFLATMSHELRTPLNSIIGFTGVILQRMAGPLNDEQAKQLEMVRGSARHLLALINDVLDISKIESDQIEIAREPFDWTSSVSKIAALVAALAERKGLIMRLECGSAMGPTLGDERRFEQILLNLLDNAIKFTDRGSVALTAREHIETDRPSARRGLLVRVSDTGIGIKPEEMAGLFQPFRQIDSGLSRSRQGTGLGLAISRRLAELMGGEIHVESEWGKGSIFSLTLPLEELLPC